MIRAEAVRPIGGNLLDLWEEMMKPFEEEDKDGNNQRDEEERIKVDNPKEGSEDHECEEKGESIDDNEEEGAMVRVARAEIAPSKEEVAMHMVNHIPFRSWCAHCVRGKASGNPHRKKKTIGGEREEPVV